MERLRRVFHWISGHNIRISIKYENEKNDYRDIRTLFRSQNFQNRINNS